MKITANTIDEFFENCGKHKENAITIDKIISKYKIYGDRSLHESDSITLLGYNFVPYKNTCYDGVYPMISMAPQKNSLNLYINFFYRGNEPITKGFANIFGKSNVGISCIKIRKLTAERIDAINDIIKLIEYRKMGVDFTKKSPPILLASSSPRRKELLKTIFDDFLVGPREIDEKEISNDHEGDLYSLPIFLSYYKAINVAHKALSNTIVIGADTIVICEDELLEKPKNEAEAKYMLELISNNTNTVITGVTLVYNDIVHSFSDSTNITLKKLDAKFIDDYIKSGAPFDKSGGYGIQDLKDKYLEKIDGDINNVIGFPLEKFIIEYEKFISKI